MSYKKILSPNDDHNQRLESNVHPKDWQNPTPSGPYNMVVIGAGTAGLVTAAGAAGLGAKVALVERSLMGGDCLNVGCVPSKALLAAARRVGEIRNASELGIQVRGSIDVDFGFVMERMRKLRADISPHDSAARFKDLGIDVFLGSAEFTSDNTVSVDGSELRFRRACIATGGRANASHIPGISSITHFTNETIFTLTELPPSLTIIGGGPIGCELAQCFARFGSQVTLIDRNERILAKEEPDAANLVQSALENDGVRLRLGASIQSTREDDDIKIADIRRSDGSTESIHSSHILVAAGRSPNVQGLGLDVAGIEFDEQMGISVSDTLQTSNPIVYAAGDVCSRFQFTHAADYQARIVIQNALFPSRAKSSHLVIPWCTYTSPELARVGLSSKEAAEQGIEIDTYTQEFSAVDRAILEGMTTGFVRVHCKKGSDKIIGGTIVGESAGDLISEITFAMTHNLGLQAIGKTIHPYPTRADAIRKLGDQYSKTRLSPTVKWIFDKWLSWRR
jgi:pyruvate/2-oxoglutarate dehydrogenase complex dihydrolipoamide dehydrogenase (E3) component